ncbi:MAG: hypothetical protein M3Z32_03355 [Acidobacteriota bacterium]|nr:hypothetical protein [Acidobacteriota bacterium]
MSDRTHTLLRSDTGGVFVKVPAGLDPPQLVPLKSTTFRNWLIATSHTNHGVLPRSSTIRHTIRALELKAVDLPPVSIALRIASTPGKVLLDLHNHAGEAIEITPQGWRITPNHTAHFLGTRSLRALPAPEHPTARTLESLRTLLGLTPEDFARCLSWLVAALSPTGPYPILVLQSSVASAKSSLASMLRALIDPGAAPFCPLPQSDRDLDSLILHNWIIALDHIDLLSRAKLKRLLAHSRTRPMIFTTELMLPHDLQASVIRVALPASCIIPSQKAFDHLRPQILGALCNTVVENTSVPWQTFTNAPDPIAVAITKHLHSNTKWTGTATELLIHLRAIDPATPWPATPKGLTQLLRRTTLDGIIFQSHKGSGGRRSISLEKTNTPKTCADAPHPLENQNPLPVHSRSTGYPLHSGDPNS